MRVQVIPSGAPLGAEVRGVDIAAGVDEATLEAVLGALHEHSVIVLRGQRLTIPAQRDFASHFGPPEPHSTRYTAPGYRDVLVVSNKLDERGEPIGITDAGRVWHTDGRFDEYPTMYSMLYAVEVPHDEAGAPLGSTHFVSTAVAYDRLPQATKQRIDSLRADNTIRHVHRYFRAHGIGKKRDPLTKELQERLATHKVVRTHPVTGRRCIYVSVAHTERVHGMAEDEGRALVEELQRACSGDESLVYRHRWQVGDLLIWDNCATQHYAVGDYGEHQPRLMYRVSVAGLQTA